jgi:hypothetical protein
MSCTKCTCFGCCADRGCWTVATIAVFLVAGIFACYLFARSQQPQKQAATEQVERSFK